MSNDKSDGERGDKLRGGQRRESKPRDGQRRDYAPRDGGKRPFTPRDGEKRPYKPRDGEKRPYRPRDGDAPKRPYKPREGDDQRRPYRPRDGDEPKRPYQPRDGEARAYQPRQGESQGYRGRDDRGPRRDDRGPRRDDRGPRRDGDRRGSRPPQEERAERIPAPEIPEDVTGKDLAPAARNELKTLSKENAEEVSRHLAMAVRLIDEDPELAHEHALAAARRAGRIAIVRETAAITAYALGDYALALRELRTYRRISGKDDQIALLVDSERGVGRPEKALEEGRAVDREKLTPAVRAELAIAMSGAYLDLEQPERALQALDIAEYDPDRAYPWSPDLFAARATVLEDLGRDDEAAELRQRARVAEEALAEASGGEVGDDDVIFVEEIEQIELPEEGADAEEAAEAATDEDSAIDADEN